MGNGVVRSNIGVMATIPAATKPKITLNGYAFNQELRGSGPVECLLRI